jgi:CheY-like chemotaxis protein
MFSQRGETEAQAEREIVLIVDDEESIRKVTSSMVKKLGYRPCPAASGPEAVEQLSELGEQVRIALVDLTMPGMDGYETCRRLVQIQPQLPVILTSGYPQENMEMPFEQTPAAGFCQKPFLVQSLKDVMAQVTCGS